MKNPTSQMSKTSKIIAILFSALALSCATRAHDMTKNLLEGNEAALKGDYQAAVSHYESALKAVPDSAAAKRNLGIVMVKVGNYKRAKVLLAEALLIYNKDIEVYYFLGESMRGLEEFQSAAAQYQKALRLDPNDLRIVKALSWAWYKMGFFERTLAATGPLLQNTPEDLQLRLIVGSALNRQKKFKESIEVLSYIEKPGFKIQSGDRITADSERALILTALAESYSGIENCTKAIQIFNGVLNTRPFLASALTGAAKCELKQNSTGRALAKLERATKADSTTKEANMLLGKIYEKSDSVKAVYYYRRFLLLTKDNPEFASDAQTVKATLAKLEKKM